MGTLCGTKRVETAKRIMEDRNRGSFLALETQACRVKKKLKIAEGQLWI